MPANNDGLFPSRNEPGYILDNNGLSKDCAIEYVSDGSIGAFPHAF